MSSYANQYLYLITKKREKKEDIFLMLSWNQYLKAANTLSASGLKLYMYLAKNKDGYKFYFSPKDFMEKFNISDRTYRNAKNELMEKGYLIDIGSNKIEFNTAGVYIESIESLKEQLLSLGKNLSKTDKDSYNEMTAIIKKEITIEVKADKDLYKEKLKELIETANGLLDDTVEQQWNV